MDCNIEEKDRLLRSEGLKATQRAIVCQAAKARMNAYCFAVSLYIAFNTLLICLTRPCNCLFPIVRVDAKHTARTAPRGLKHEYPRSNDDRSADRGWCVLLQLTCPDGAREHEVRRSPSELQPRTYPTEGRIPTADLPHHTPPNRSSGHSRKRPRPKDENRKATGDFTHRR